MSGVDLHGLLYQLLDRKSVSQCLPPEDFDSPGNVLLPDCSPIGCCQGCYRWCLGFNCMMAWPLTKFNNSYSNLNFENSQQIQSPPSANSTFSPISPSFSTPPPPPHSSFSPPPPPLPHCPLVLPAPRAPYPPFSHLDDLGGWQHTRLEGGGTLTSSGGGGDPPRRHPPRGRQYADLDGVGGGDTHANRDGIGSGGDSSQRRRGAMAPASRVAARPPTLMALRAAATRLDGVKPKLIWAQTPN